MRRLAVRREFTAQHYLKGGNWGAENELHPHHYRVEVELQGTRLDRHGYLVDIVDVESSLEAVTARYRGQTLNDLPEFEGLNPSLERFAEVFLKAVLRRLETSDLDAVTVRLWESEQAWASCSRAL